MAAANRDYSAYCVCGRCKTTWMARGWECPQKFALHQIRRQSARLSMSAEEANNTDRLSLSIVKGITGDVLYSREIQKPLLCYTLIRWCLTYIRDYDPRHRSGQWTYCSYLLPGGNHGRLHLLTLLLDLLDMKPPDGTFVIQLFWNATSACEVCGHRVGAEIFPTVHCSQCGQRPCRHHRRCCRNHTQFFKSLGDPLTCLAFLFHLLDRSRFERILRDYNEFEIYSLCSQPPWHTPW